jgi:prepilin-type processing-associated H-X9-DG protein
MPPAGTYAPPEEARSLKWGYMQAIDLKSGTNYSWVVKTLPYLEESTVSDQFNLSLPVTSNTTEPQAYQPQVLLCPSDGTLGRFLEVQDPNGTRIVQFGKANYAAFVNPFHTDSWAYSGAISLYGQRLPKISDGMTNTLLLAEIRTRDHIGDERGAWALPWSGASLLAFDMHPSRLEGEGCAPFECHEYEAILHEDRNEGPKFAPWRGSIGYTHRPNGRHPDILYTCPEPETAQLDRMPCAEFEKAHYMSAAARSNHPGGVNVAFLDARADFLNNDVDEFVMAIMISTDDGLTPFEHE